MKQLCLAPRAAMKNYSTVQAIKSSLSWHSRVIYGFHYTSFQLNKKKKQDKEFAAGFKDIFICPFSALHSRYLIFVFFLTTTTTVVISKLPVVVTNFSKRKLAQKFKNQRILMA